jgi:hypothetical protein
MFAARGFSDQFELFAEFEVIAIMSSWSGWPGGRFFSVLQAASLRVYRFREQR